MHVEIWSDIACPWCYVGKRRFEAALAAYEHAGEVEVSWRSFELDPTAPAERGGDHASHLAAKYGVAHADALAMNATMTETAAGEGLEFRLDRVRGGSTFDAHRLLHLAADHGRQDTLKERLMRAYLTEGELMSDPGTLRRLAAEAGLPGDAVDELLATDAHAGAVREDARTVAALGVQAVPFFAVDRRIGASGAQAPAVLLAMLRQARPTEPAIPTVAAGEACGPDGC